MSKIPHTSQMEHLSITYVKAIAYFCGYDANEPKIDYDSIDLVISSSAGRKPRIDIQLKSTTQIEESSKDFSFSLPVKNYNDLRGDTLVPRYLIILCMPKSQSDWLIHSEEELALRKCAYWTSIGGQPETNNKETVNIKIPIGNVFSPNALIELMSKADGSKYESNN